MLGLAAALSIIFFGVRASWIAVAGGGSLAPFLRGARPGRCARLNLLRHACELRVVLGVRNQERLYLLYPGALLGPIRRCSRRRLSCCRLNCCRLRAAAGLGAAARLAFLLGASARQEKTRRKYKRKQAYS